MCIAAFLWKAHPLYPFLLFHNRDEYFNRPTTPLAWWDNDEILGGKDNLAGGTWLGCNSGGKIAFVTNVREVNSSSSRAKSRGELAIRFLRSGKSPRGFAEELVGEAELFDGFNLIVVDIGLMTMLYITNRPKDRGVSVTEVSPGIHVLSNATLDSPWPKAQRLHTSFEELLQEYSESEIPLETAAKRLMRDTTRDETGNLPGIYEPELEYQLSSIFIETERPSERYGTRSTSAIAVNSSFEVKFYETYLENDLWKEQTICFQIEKSR